MSSSATEVLRVSSSLKKAAADQGRLFNRKAAQQLEYWAQIGRTLESLPSVSLDRIRACLQAESNLDDLNTEEKAIAFARLHDLECQVSFDDLGTHKHKAGQAYTALDKQGRVIRVHPDGKKEILK